MSRNIQNGSVYERARAWCILDETAKELGLDTFSLSLAMENGNLAALIKSARDAAANPNDTSDQNYDLNMSLMACGVRT